MACWSCHKVKGKRACPAHGGDTICSKCCGTKRGVEVRCPEDCPYLHGEHDARWEPPSRKTEEALFIAQFAGVTREKLPLLVFLHHLLLQGRRDLVPDLADQDALEVVGTLSRTLVTRSKGIVYEHKSESPRLQALIGWIGKILEVRQEIAGVPRASDAEVADMLEAISSAMRAYREQSTSARSYLDTAGRVFSASLEDAPSLEIPGKTARGGLIIEP